MEQHHRGAERKYAAEEPICLSFSSHGTTRGDMAWTAQFWALWSAVNEEYFQDVCIRGVALHATDFSYTLAIRFKKTSPDKPNLVSQMRPWDWHFVSSGGPQAAAALRLRLGSAHTPSASHQLSWMQTLERHRGGDILRPGSISFGTGSTRNKHWSLAYLMGENSWSLLFLFDTAVKK